MPDPFDAYQYFTHLRARWRLPAVVVTVALATALAISLLVSKKYTAKVTLVIDPPAGSDPRASGAVSPVYLESLKTYEHYASSDQLFAQAVDRFQLRRERPSGSLESLKRSVLEVSVPRNTKILEIEATLRDPRSAHALASYIAEETIKLNRKTNRAGDEELIREAKKRLEEAAQRRSAAEEARNRAARRSPTPAALRADLEQLQGVREEVDRLLLSAELSTAEASKTRAERLARRAEDLDRQIAAKQELLARRNTEIDSLNTEYDFAWAAHEEAARRLRELEATAGSRGERLHLLDPGVPPERPSFPKIPLNLLVAAALALIASLLYVTLEFSLQSQKSEALRKSLRVASKP